MSDDLDELTKAEQRGYANAMEAERKLHEDRIEQLERERERLALAICGGEDAPGYANAQTVEDLEKVARDNAAWGMWQVDQTVQAQAKLAKAVEVLRFYADGLGMPGLARTVLAELEGEDEQPS